MAHFTILDTEDTSNALDVRGHTIVALVFDDAFDGGGVTFLASLDNAAFSEMVGTDGAAFTVTCQADDYVQLGTGDLHGVRYLKLVSDTNQSSGDTVVTAVLAKVT